MTLAKAARRLKPPVPGRVPRLLLVTDETRLPDPLPAAARLPAGSGVILRHYGWPPERRAELGRRLAALARRRRLVLLVAGDWRLAARLGAAGIHLPEGMAGGRVAQALGWARRRGRLVTAAAHSRAALARAKRLGLDAALLSPVFATRSHEGAPCLGPLRFALMARRAGLAVVALGGIDARRAGRLPPGSASGLAAIGALA